MGPFNTPWSTFLAWLVGMACIAFSIIWAVFFYKPEEDDHE